MTASILRLAVLGLVLTIAQGTDPGAGPDPGTVAKPGPRSNPGTRADSEDVETLVPAIIEDPSCDSGQRNVVKVFKNGSLLRTERKKCVGA